MKNRTIKIISLIALSSLTSCSYLESFSSRARVPENNEEHAHTYKEEWSFDDLNHWHDTSCEHDGIKDLAPHQMGAWQTVSQPTEYKVGIKQRECFCGYIEKEEIEVLKHEHTYSQDWSYDNESHWHASLCGCEEKMNEATHDFSEWKTVKEPKYDIEGLKERSCSICGYVEQSPIEPDNSGEEYTTYRIKYYLNGGVNDKDNPTTYTCMDEFDLLPATRTGYTFLGWLDEDQNEITRIEKGTAGYLKIYAKWNDGNKYNVTLNPNGGLLDETVVEVQYDHQYELPTPSYEQHTFSGWYGNGTWAPNTGVWRVASDIELIAHWEADRYDITYILDGGTNSENNPSTYTVDESIQFSDPARAGYSFDGWYIGEDNITGIDKGTTGSIELTAKWSPVQNVLSVSSQDDSRGSAEITSGTGYTDEEITVTAAPKSNCVFKGWYCDDTKVSDSDTYTFVMPASDYSLVAHFNTQEEEQEEINKINFAVEPIVDVTNKKVKYGMYPQTVVDDETLVSTLNSLDSSYIKMNGWYFYDNFYYAKVKVSPNSYAYKFHNGKTISTGYHWFKCEPIEWKIIDTINGGYLLISSLVIGTRRFHNGTSKNPRTAEDNYPNSFSYSDISYWLNGLNGSSILNVDYSTNGFAKQAFTLGNSSLSYYAGYKVSLFKVTDYQTRKYGLYNNADRCCSATDYSIATGTVIKGGSDSSSMFFANYWTATGSTSSTTETIIVSTDGTMNTAVSVIDGNTGIRPVIYIIL